MIKSKKQSPFLVGEGGGRDVPTAAAAAVGAGTLGGFAGAEALPAAAGTQQKSGSAGQKKIERIHGGMYFNTGRINSKI